MSNSKRAAAIEETLNEYSLSVLYGVMKASTTVAINADSVLRKDALVLDSTTLATVEREARRENKYLARRLAKGAVA